jgi:threonine/homoserine/homoserine lactone efflux protein
MDPHTLILFALTEAAMALSPGPAVMLAMSNGTRHGVRGAAVGAAGIELGNATWFVFSAAGLTALLLASTTAFAIIKWAGAAYLLFLGVKLLRSRGWQPGEMSPAPRGALVAQGFLTQMSNPKAVIFFGALLPQFIDTAAPFAHQFLILGVLTLAIDYSALILYGWLADRGARLAGGPKLLQWFDRVAGAFLLGAGARLAV